MKRRLWDEFLTERDQKVFSQGGFGNLAGMGTRPALLIIDVSYNFCGDRREPILESIKRFHNSCGEDAWDALPKGNGFNRDGNDIMDEIAPSPQDIVIRKLKPSAFYGTPLTGFLNDLGADSLIVTGTTTSGCVRASVLDAFSNNLRCTVVEEGCFDRSQASHAINLCDMHAKYADVVGVDEALTQIDKIEHVYNLPTGTSPV